MKPRAKPLRIRRTGSIPDLELPSLVVRKRAALYMRVSSDEQTTTNQRPELARIAKTRGLSIVKEYVETQSAAKVRPVFDGMIDDAHRGEFDVLLVWALDRFGRSMLGNLQAIIKLDRSGVQVMSARESWLEMEGPARQLLIGVFSWVAEQERRRLSERTKAGMERARASGRSIGRPRAHVPISVARELLASGRSARDVATELGTSPASLARALARAGGSKGVSGGAHPK